jgi:DMSO reductase anchor subunit
MGASLAHLGRPHLAWKAIIGVRHSWVSREIIVLSLFTGLTAIHALVMLLGGSSSVWLGAGAAAAGVAAVGCSVAIYAATGRRWWRTPALAVRFGATVASGALGVELIARPALAVAAACAATTAVALVFELAVLRHRRAPRSELGQTAVLLTGELAPVLVRRVVLALLGGVALPIFAGVAASHDAIAAARVVGSIGLAAFAAAALIERQLMFTASAAPRMPGPLR